MDIFQILLIGAFLFIIIYVSVRLAISPLIAAKGLKEENSDVTLAKLRDIGVITSRELEEIILIYRRRGKDKKKHMELDKFTNILHELNDFGYINNEDFQLKLDLLNRYYNNK